jgi:hypothetical protein
MRNKNKLKLDKGEASIFIQKQNGIIKMYHGDDIIIKSNSRPLNRSFAYQGKWSAAIGLLTGDTQIRRSKITMTKFLDIMENWLTPLIILFAVLYFTTHFILF